MDKRNDEQPSKPAWVIPALEKSRFWTSIRVPDDRADELIAFSLWSDPMNWPVMEQLEKSFFAALLRAKARLEGADWSRFDTRALLNMILEHVALRTSVDTFLPQAYADLSLPVRCWLYAHLLVHDEAILSPTGLLDAPPYLLRRAMVCYLAGLFARAEIVRRGVKHVGVHGGLLLLLMEVFPRLDPLKDPIPAQAADRAVEALRKASYPNPRSEKAARNPAWKRVMKVLLNSPWWRSLTTAEHREEYRQELDGQIYLTLDARSGSGHGVEKFARSLDEEMNFLPLAIGESLARQAEREDKGKAVEVFSESGDWDDVLPSPGRDADPPAPDHLAELKELLEPVNRDPRIRQLLRARLEGEGQKEIARELGVSDRWVRELGKTLKKMLTED